MANGLLAVAFDFSSTNADEFHDWYDTEHIPEREAVPGFGACERWMSAEEPTHALATYDLDTNAVLKSPDYLAIAYENSSPWTKRLVGQCKRLIRFEGEQLTPGNTAAPTGAGGLLINAMNVSADGEADFNAWYDEEHLPALAAVPGCMVARRYRATEGGSSTHKYVAVYHLENADITHGAAWKTAVDTPWSARVRPHFRDRVRILTNRYQRDT